MAKNKTTETSESPLDFVNSVENEQKRKDALELIELFEEQTGLKAKMWGPGIIGFGSYHYKYESGHEGDAPMVAFSPRKNAISLYLYLPVEKREELLRKFGKHKTGKGCIYVNKLADIDTTVLKQMITSSIEQY